MDGQTDRRTDRRTEFSSLDRVCIACSAVKTIYDARSTDRFERRSQRHKHVQSGSKSEHDYTSIIDFVSLCTSVAVLDVVSNSQVGTIDEFVVVDRYLI